MASVVIVHAADDALPARALGEKLRQAKLTPVIEKQAGQERQNAIKGAAVTIALWSPRSVGDASAVSDVSFADTKGKLIHASMQNVMPPEPFRNANYVDLTGWRGEDNFHAWRELAKRVTHAAGVPNLPPPAGQHPSGFFQPGRVGAPQAAPQQGRQQQQRQQQRPQQAQQQRQAPRPVTPAPEREQKSGGGRMMLIAVIVLLVVGALGGGAWWFMNRGSGVAADWAEVSQSGDPAALRAFIARDDAGEFRDDAQQAYLTLAQSRYAEAEASGDIESFRAFTRDFSGSDGEVRELVNSANGQIAMLEQRQADTPPEVPAAPPPADLPPLTEGAEPGPAQSGEPAPQPEAPPEAQEPGATPG